MRGGPVTVVIAVTSEPWAGRLAAWIADHADDALLRDHYVFDRQEAHTQDYDCLVCDADASLLDAALVRQLHRCGRTVVGVTDPSQARDQQRLDDLGVDREVAKDASPAEMLNVIVEVARTRADFDAVVDGLEVAAAEPDGDGPDPVGGCVTAVAGAGGGVGASEVAIETAVALRRRGESTTLVDADLTAPSAAQRLRLPWESNLNTAVDAVVHGSGTVADALVSSATGGFDVLVGIEPRKWADVHAEELGEVLDAMRSLCQHTVATVGPFLEQTPGGRHAAARAAVGDADRVVVVGHATPLGVERVSRWLVDAGELTDLARVHVVFNRSPGGDAAAQLDHELLRTAAVAGVAHLPTDRKVTRACWAGEIARPGRFTRAVRKQLVAGLPRASAAAPPRRRLWTVRA